MSRDRQTNDGSSDEQPDEFKPTGKWANPAIYASNWRSIIIIDAILGLVMVMSGILIIWLWNLWIGAFLGAVGLTYVVAVGRRYLQWRWLRRQAGLFS